MTNPHREYTLVINIYERVQAHKANNARGYPDIDVPGSSRTVTEWSAQGDDLESLLLKGEVILNLHKRPTAKGGQ